MLKKSRRQIKAEASAFEIRVKRDINNEPDSFAIKIPESVKGVFGKGKPILAKTECDMIAYVNGVMAIFDCKERDKEKFYINEICLSKKSCHQYFFMKEAQNKVLNVTAHVERTGQVHAGYLCHFKPLGIIAWISLYKIKRTLEAGKTVIELSDLLEYNKQPHNQRINMKRLMGV